VSEGEEMKKRELMDEIDYLKKRVIVLEGMHKEAKAIRACELPPGLYWVRFGGDPTYHRQILMVGENGACLTLEWAKGANEGGLNKVLECELVEYTKWESA
jgi:hypothetical protein